MCIRDRSNSSQSIIDALLKEVQAKNFEIKTQSVVLEIQKLESGFKIITKEEEIFTDFVIYTLSLIHI